MKIVVGITGATGVIYGVRLLEKLASHSVETHLVMSQWGKKTLELETSLTVEEVQGLANYHYDELDLAGAIASGSFLHDGMVIAPCTMKTLAGIRHGFSQNLIQRAADVTLKEGRKLILMPRESPLSTIHLENMLGLSQMGVKIVPPMPAFYQQPQTIEEIIDSSIHRVFDLLGIQREDAKRWGNLS